MDLDTQEGKYVIGKKYTFTVDSREGMMRRGYPNEYGDIKVPFSFTNEMRRYCLQTYDFVCESFSTLNGYYRFKIIGDVRYTFSDEMFEQHNNTANVLFNL